MGFLPNEAWMVLGSWAFWLAVFCGVGALLWKRPGFDGWMLRFWCGWSCVLFFLQLWHFFLPVDGRAVVAVALLGAAGLFRSRREAGAVFRLLLRRWAVFFAVLVVAAWLSQLALGGVRNGDSGLYHLPVMHWTTEYPVVPGLANLHVRFASNQSALLYAALCNAGPVSGIGTHTMNGLLIFVLLVQGMAGLVRIALGQSRHRRGDTYLALFLVPTAAQALTLNMTSPSPDVSVFVCGAALMAMVLGFFETLWARDGLAQLVSSANDASESELSHPRPNHSWGGLLAIAVFAVAGVTVKLSLAFLSGLALAAAILGWFWRIRPRHVDAAWMAAMLALVVFVGFGTWIGRNAVLSGTLVYPVPSTRLPLDWTIPIGILEAERRFIGSWNGSLSLAALGNGKWVLQALRSFGWQRWDVYAPLVLAVASLPGVLLLGPLRRERFPHALLMVPTLSALVSWFIVAPVPRFAGAALWSFAFQMLLWAFDGLASRVLPRLFVLAAVAALPLLPLLQNAPALSGFRSFEPESPVRVEARVLPGGLEVLVPKDDVCRSGPLLCTPTPTPGLRLRRPGDLGGGFVIDPELAASAAEPASSAATAPPAVSAPLP